MKADEIVKKIKAMVSEGNVAHVLVKCNDTAVLNIPVDDEKLAEIRLGAVRPVWKLLLSAIGTSGPDCTIYVEKNDGSTTIVNGRDS